MTRVDRRQAEPQLDDLIHPSNRLRVCAALAAASQVEFSVVQRAVGLSASALSKQVHTLIDGGYVAQSRHAQDSRRIWLRLTPTGRAAYRTHLEALQRIIGGEAGLGSDDSAAVGVETST